MAASRGPVLYSELDLTINPDNGKFDYVARYYALSSGGTLRALTVGTNVAQADLMAALVADVVTVGADFTAEGYPPA